MKKWGMLAILLTTMLGTSCGTSPPDNEQDYTWKSMHIGGGGYVTGLLVHPLDSNIVYSRTDVGGAYRWDPQGERWLPLLDEFTDKGYFSVEAMALDPSAAGKDKVYAALGNGASRDVLRSAKQGEPGSWVPTGMPSNVKMYGNADYRWAGDRLEIDPNKSGRVFFGTRENGLYLNPNIEASTVEHPTWQQVPLAQIPVGSGKGAKGGTAAVGVTFVAFDPSGGTDIDGNTKRIYAGVFGNGVYESEDAGATFKPLAGSPSLPVQGRVDPRGKLYVTYVAGKVIGQDYDGGGVVFWMNGAWTNITPGKVNTPYAGLDIDMANPDRIVVAERKSQSHNKMYYSKDGGSTWSSNRTPPDSQQGGVPWWPKSYFASAMASVRFAPDKEHPGRVWFSDWYGTWRTDDITAAAGLEWRSFEQGHEEVVTQTLKSPPPQGDGDALLFSGLADVGGFRHTNLDEFPPADNKYHAQPKDVQDTDSLDVFEGDNRIVYRVGNIRNKKTGNGWKSTDNGKTWTIAFDPASDPVLPDNARGGKIAVSALNADTIVWLPLDNRPYTSQDGGATWSPAKGIAAANIVRDEWDTNLSLASNKTKTNKFYIYKPNVGFYVSNSGNGAGSDFTQVKDNGLPGSGKADSYAVASVPGQDGGVWVALSGAGDSADGIYVSADYGSKFTKLGNVQTAERLAFGAAKPGTKYPAAAYLFGKANGDAEKGVYRSDDMGASWKRINDADHRFGSGVRVLEADRKLNGRVYVGTSGRGVYYGELVKPGG